MKQPLVSIITVNYNQAEVTYELLKSIQRNSYSNIETIVVDNASKPEENPGEYIQAHFPTVKFIRSEDNLGFAGGNNLGIEACSGDYLFFVNNDAELTDGVLEYMVGLFEQIPDLGALSPLICYYTESQSQKQDLIQYAGTTPVHSLTARNKTIGEQELDNGQYAEPYPTAYAHGAAMMINREVLERVGPWPEEFFLYYEELDWCAQIRRAGYSIYVEPRAKVYHKESVSVGRMSTLKTYYLNRNRILFMRRNKNSAQLLAFLLFLIFFTIPKNSLMYLVKGEFKHLRVFWRAVLWHLNAPKDMLQTQPLAPALKGA